MKTGRNLCLGGFGVLLIVFLAIAIVPQLCPTSVGYFDIKNGKRKSEWRCLGLTYKVRVYETDYSRMLNKLGVVSLESEWKPTSETRNKMICKEYWDYSYGRIAHDAEEFAEALEKVDSTTPIMREKARYFQELVGKGDSGAIRQYVDHIEASRDHY
jgi:hypothetical protein